MSRTGSWTFMTLRSDHIAFNVLIACLLEGCCDRIASQASKELDLAEICGLKPASVDNGQGSKLRWWHTAAAPLPAINYSCSSTSELRLRRSIGVKTQLFLHGAAFFEVGQSRDVCSLLIYRPIAVWQTKRLFGTLLCCS